MTDEQPLAERIVDVLREAPDEIASVETIRGLLAREEGVRPATEDVREKADALAEEGRVDVVSSTDEGRRYRLLETDY